MRSVRFNNSEQPMISDAVFITGMGQLAGAFGREIDGPVSLMYHSLLSPHLTDEQFVDAVTRTIGSEKFWPPPALILEKAGVSPQQRSEGALRIVNDALFQHGGYRFLPAAISTAWDAPTWAAIRAVGGLKEITLCTEEDWPKLQAKFRRAYEAAIAPKGKALPSGEKTQQQVVDLVRSVARDRSLPRGDR